MLCYAVQCYALLGELTSSREEEDPKNILDHHQPCGSHLRITTSRSCTYCGWKYGTMCIYVGSVLLFFFRLYISPPALVCTTYYVLFYYFSVLGLQQFDKIDYCYVRGVYNTFCLVVGDDVWYTYIVGDRNPA